MGSQPGDRNSPGGRITFLDSLEHQTPTGATYHPLLKLSRTWSGQVISTLGTTASGIVYPSLILALTNSPTAAGIVGALGAIPYLIFSLPVGALIDRWDRKCVMILCDIGRGLTLASIPVAVALNTLTIWQLYLAAFIEGSLFVFFNIAATLPRVVVKEQLPEAAAQNEAAFGAAAIIGPAFGRSVPFLADAISYSISIVSLSFIRTPFQYGKLGYIPFFVTQELIVYQCFFNITLKLINIDYLCT